MTVTLTLRPVAAVAVDEAIGLEKDIFGLQAWPADEVIGFLSLQTVDGFVAYVDEAAAGYILWQRVADEAEIITIGVRENYRRSGVAGQLLEKSLASLRHVGVTQIFLHVRLSNKAAQRLYEKYGFKQISLRKHYYEPMPPHDKSEDALIYRLEI